MDQKWSIIFSVFYYSIWQYICIWTIFWYLFVCKKNNCICICLMCFVFLCPLFFHLQVRTHMPVNGRGVDGRNQCTRRTSTYWHYEILNISDDNVCLCESAYLCEFIQYPSYSGHIGMHESKWYFSHRKNLNTPLYLSGLKL